jgi:hypothetical protein
LATKRQSSCLQLHEDSASTWRLSDCRSPAKRNCHATARQY